MINDLLSIFEPVIALLRFFFVVIGIIVFLFVAKILWISTLIVLYYLGFIEMEGEDNKADVND
ncbi:hypothetical protein [Candidatus Magnetominusculus dajiuhuensis]|uniref:hypothetical protein n=1 Tax=Candidatus Magnetominusculus dajiuhuensis TaxID=3137712 RepID=UPI003B43092B